MLKLYPITLELAREGARVVARLERRDPDLARQLRRALASVPLNVAEGSGSQGKLRVARYYTALGSAREALACVEVAEAMGHLDGMPEQLRARFDRVIGTLVRLTRGRG